MTTTLLSPDIARRPDTNREVPLRVIDTPDIEAVAAELAALPSYGPPILSCYLRLGSRHRQRRGYRIEFKAQVQELMKSPAFLALAREERLAVEGDIEQIRAYLEDAAHLIRAPGVVVFASAGRNLLTVIPLPRVYRTRVLLGATPALRELVLAERDVKPVIVVLIDRPEARILEVGPRSAKERFCLIDEHTPDAKYRGDRQDAPGRGERAFHGRILEERQRHYAHVAHELLRLIGDRPVGGIVLSGPATHTNALRRFLPTSLARLVIGEVRLNPRTATPAQVFQAAHSLAEAHDREEQLSAIAALGDAAARGWAVSGPEATLAALHRGQVRVLYLSEQERISGYRCRASGRLVIAEAACGLEGEPETVTDLLDEALEEALRQHVEIVVVENPDLCTRIATMSGLLRFR